MTFALVSNVGAGGTANTVTTGSLDSTGASLLVAVVAVGGGTTDSEMTSGKMSDSKGNVWFPAQINYSSFHVAIWYSVAASVGSSHTFTYASTLSYPSLLVAAFSCTNPIPDKWSQSSSGTPGSLTPSGDNQLFVTGQCNVDTSTVPTIGSSFTRTDYQLYVAGTHLGGSLGYKIQTTGGAENPAWNIGTLSGMVVFREYAAGGGSGGGPLVGGRLVR